MHKLSPPLTEHGSPKRKQHVTHQLLSRELPGCRCCCRCRRRRLSLARGGRLARPELALDEGLLLRGEAAGCAAGCSCWCGRRGLRSRGPLPLLALQEGQLLGGQPRRRSCRCRGRRRGRGGAGGRAGGRAEGGAGRGRPGCGAGRRWRRRRRGRCGLGRRRREGGTEVLLRDRPRGGRAPPLARRRGRPGAIGTIAQSLGLQMHSGERRA